MLLHRAGLVVAAFLAIAGVARAQSARGPEVDDGERPAPAPRLFARDLAGSGQFLPGLQTAKVSAITGSGLGFAGFDGARHTAVFSVSAEVALARWLVLRGDAIYRPGNADDCAVTRPAVSLRGRLLDQQSSGVDLAVL